MTSRILPEALDDLIDAARYYDRQRDGLGGEFEDLYREAIVDIVNSPQRYPRHDESRPGLEYRYHLLRRFSYLVIYLVRPDEVVVVAVSHTSRHPSYWTSSRA